MKLTSKDWNDIYFDYTKWRDRWNIKNDSHPLPYDCFMKLKKLVNKRIKEKEDEIRKLIV